MTDLGGSLVHGIALAATLSLVACAPAPIADERRGELVEVSRSSAGGLCAGPDGGSSCEARVTVDSEGLWTAVGFFAAVDSAGEVAPDVALDLARILDDGWDDLTAMPFTGTCPMAYDGQEVTYTVRRVPRGPGAELADAAVRAVRSCTHDLDHPAAARWIDRFARRWAEAGLPH
ncbi:MAG: hypothetical protein OEN56_01665 [Gemmatimonadota bacterium]|nr:hypothetical protein [Gemmatimonadota bacterium]